MTRLLLCYGTTDGQTAKIMRFLDAELRGLGADVTLVEADGESLPAGLSGYDGVIVAGSIHVGGFQRRLVRWVRRHREALDARPHIFLAVCLSVLQQDPAVRQELDRILRRFMHATGWHPRAMQPVAGALSYSRYGLIRRWAMRRIARKAGGGTDVSRDYEYTDWEELRRLARDFLSSSGGEAPVAVRSMATAVAATGEIT
ncbi:MAG: flavodoxin domain-containing protein [Gemmatimonadota bacterium]|nr:flavodoxin domain-containing protein [Gemmatimonadota bacterium]